MRRSLPTTAKKNKRRRIQIPTLKKKPFRTSKKKMDQNLPNF